MHRRTAVYILLVAVWLVAVSGMTLHAATVDAGENYERHMKEFAGVSIGVGCAYILYVLYAFYINKFD